MPGGPGGRPTAALGGSQLAVNARSAHPELAYALMEFLLAPEQMLERARLAGQYPSRRAMYDQPELGQALGLPPAEVRRIIEAATPRPATPVYSELSESLQIHLHRALSGQEQPQEALSLAAAEMRSLLGRVGLSPDRNTP
jgi:multiple sugar transport system substrate-binding protein